MAVQRQEELSTGQQGGKPAQIFVQVHPVHLGGQLDGLKGLVLHVLAQVPDLHRLVPAGTDNPI